MPIYEYSCDACNHSFDELQKVSASPISTCPECGEERARRVVSSSSFHLKGEGWYKDHYGLKGSSKGSNGSSNGSSSGAGKGPSKGSGSGGGE
jgi:putative FmdB family regulatory protein